ncbi:biotin--[acetyl-CoA-carboxylase] ligase [Limosilactobacillus pontis]|jgi:BirA family biotin operon repressor/biotin-[acetyl-CoA-carboxylase] ligase|uniref:biotin--[biotin carboxyl-carrier protein] ligase n=1 Tax=Limosilactobacillus pontis TaxID=35787 RepID=A0ABT7UXI9_9LACO|nr:MULTISPECIES: biotin--[acetyl-CoA-carboxylase] ligase [Limosilactobacillus]MDM8266426.1 biotin--[acetyl-CoA-carboxylase] ligase [Limosilactobacillus pontis]HJA74864.1 biotin--[acetyl-CoA-carboxylase] ligase [Candidatus Limosilactobacillus gallistercoris]
MVEKLTGPAIEQAIAGRAKIKVVVVEQTESTQLLAKNYLAHHNNEEPVVFVANQQSGGYGQHGRHFYSPAESGIYLSLLLPPQRLQQLRKAGLLTTSVAVILAEVLEQYFPQVHLSLKWVNDVFLGPKKVAGILTEAVYQLGTPAASLIIGIGVNLTTQNFPAMLANKAGALGEADNVDHNQLVADLLVALIRMLADYADGKYLAEYRQRCFLLGRTVAVKTARGVSKGIAVDISKNGGLVIDCDGKRQIIHSGEVEKVNF